MQPLTILTLCGSLRSESYNRKLLKIATTIAAQSGARIIEADLKQLAIPIYDGDLEAEHGFPESVQKLKALIKEADMLIIASPEYNHSIPGGLKNAIDWASRKEEPFEGKAAVLMGVSSGKFGTVRAQPHIRQILTGRGMLLLPTPQIFVSNGETAFAQDGSLTDPKTMEMVTRVVNKTIELTQALRSASFTMK